MKHDLDGFQIISPAAVPNRQ